MASTTYTVRPGDTLAAIARTHGVTLDALLAANPSISDPDRIAVGDRLQIPGGTAGGGSGPHPGLTIIPRGEWGAQPYRGTRAALGTVTAITVHHTATAVLPMTESEGVVQVRQVQRLHQDTNKWADVGYHFLLSQDGTWFQGRAQKTPGPDPLAGLALGSHARSRNTGNVGISVMGYFHAPKNHRMSAAAEASLRAMIATLRARYGVRADRVFGHREIGSTVCPGDLLFPLVQTIRAERIPPREG